MNLTVEDVVHNVKKKRKRKKKRLIEIFIAVKATKMTVTWLLQLSIEQALQYKPQRR